MTDGDSATPRFRWLDRWLEPRWRALLTWVVIAAATTLLYRHSVLGWIQSSIEFVQARLLAYSPLLPAGTSRMVAVESLFAFLWLWFPPLLLRLGLVRTLAWITTGVAFELAYIAGIYPRLPWALWTTTFALYALSLGLPTLAMIGRRTRPWIGLVAGGLYAGCLIASESTGNPPRIAWYVSVPLAHLIYGAVMLYCTDPLPRRPAERPLGEDQR